MSRLKQELLPIIAIGALAVGIALALPAPLAHAAGGVVLMDSKNVEISDPTTHTSRVECTDGSGNVITCAGSGAASAGGGIGANPFTQQANNVTMALTSASSNAAVTAETTLRITNPPGGADAYCLPVSSGAGTVTTASGTRIAAGTTDYLSQLGDAFLACITSAATTTITVAPGITVEDGVKTNIASAPTLGGAANGLTKKRISALTNSATAVFSSAAHQTMLMHCGNDNASKIYIQMFDVATAGAVTLGTTPPDLSIDIEPTQSTGFTLSLVGVQWANGLQVAATTTATGSTAPGTAADCNFGYN